LVWAKEIVDKRTLPKEIYDYLLKSDFIPKYQWDVIEPKTRIRFWLSRILKISIVGKYF
jgi:hypothetical protein